MTSDVIQPIHDGVDIIIKLLRSLVIKAAEIIVQARDGSNVTTKCFPISTDFFTFNLNIREIVEVERDVKRLMNPISDRWSVCIEIDLKTPGGVHMVLETWNVYLMTNSCEDIPSITVHNRLGLLLKSLLTITRVVPGYRYARKQTPDSHKLSYKIYTGEPQYNLLGDECKHYKVGSVVTPLGTVHLAVHYRTKMSISPQTSQIGATMMVKSNHFENNCISNSDPKPDPNKNSEPNDDLFNHTEFEKRIIPFGEDSNKQLNVDDVISDIPFKFLLPKPPSSSPPINETKPAVIEESSKDDSNANVVTSAAVTKSTSSNTDDFIMVDVVKTPPFAELTDNMELSNFYQEFLTAPPLLGFGEDSKVRDLVGDLTSQLESYESTSIEFDKLVNSLCEQDDEQQEAEDAESPSNSRSPHFFF